MTVKDLKDFGADTEEGMARCMGNEEFYLKMIDIAMKDENLEKLGAELKENDLDAAFETAHALKGVYGNLSLTPIFTPLSEMTEKLRNRTDMDYTEIYEKALKKRDELKALWEA